MTNPLLNPSEQAHIDRIRAIQHSPDDHYPTLPAGQPTNAWEALRGFLAQADYHKVFLKVVLILVLASFVFASFKLAAIYGEHHGLAFLSFLNMHYPIMLFSGLFTFKYIQHRKTEAMAIIGLFSTMLNALLV
jgi:hypothetical protein